MPNSVLSFYQINSEDVDLVYGWANDPITRANSFNQNPIPYKDHINWFNRRLESKEDFFFIICDNDSKIGSVRLDLVPDNDSLLFNNTVYEISYQVAPSYRGMGYGKKIIELIDVIVDDCIRNKINDNNVTLIGKVKASNNISCKCFESNSYDAISNQDDIITYAKHIALTNG